MVPPLIGASGYAEFSYVLFMALVGVIAVERVVEMAVSLRNARWSFARGGMEYGRGHYPTMVVLHTGLLVGAVAEVWLAERRFLPVLGVVMLVVVLASQVLRWWCVHALGRQWNTRVIVVPGATLVRRGPYRLIGHPNYVAVVVEGIALPLVHTAWLTAACFTVANAALLAVRLRVESSALGALSPPTEPRACEPS